LKLSKKRYLLNFPPDQQINSNTEINYITNKRRYNSEYDLPDFGEGSAFNYKARQELIQKRISKYSSNHQEYEVEAVNDEHRRLYSVHSEGNFNSNSDYFILQQKDHNTFELVPVDKWLKLKPKNVFKAMDSDQAESFMAKKANDNEKLSMMLQEKIDSKTTRDFEDIVGKGSTVKVRKQQQPQVSANSKPKKLQNKRSNLGEMSDSEGDGEEFYGSSDDGEKSDTDSKMSQTEKTDSKSDGNSESELEVTDDGASKSMESDVDFSDEDLENDSFLLKSSSKSKSSKAKSNSNAAADKSNRKLEKQKATKESKISKKRKLSDIRAQNERPYEPSAPRDKIPAAKKEKLTQTPENVDNAISIETVRQILLARPLTIRQLLKNFRDRNIDINESEQKQIVDIIKQLNPKKTRKNGELFLSLS